MAKYYVQSGNYQGVVDAETRMDAAVLVFSELADEDRFFGELFSFSERGFSSLDQLEDSLDDESLYFISTGNIMLEVARRMSERETNSWKEGEWE